MWHINHKAHCGTVLGPDAVSGGTIILDNVIYIYTHTHTHTHIYMYVYRIDSNDCKDSNSIDFS